MAFEEKTVRIRLTRADLMSFHLRSALHNRLLMGMLGVGFVLMVMTNLKGPPNSSFGFGARLAISILSALLILVFVGVIVWAYVFMLIWTSKYQNLLRESELHITAEGLASKSEVGEGSVKWAGIHKVVSTRKRLFIYMNETTARIVPRRCFPTPEAASAFEQELRSKLGERAGIARE
jgi:hypothetical protein